MKSEIYEKWLEALSTVFSEVIPEYPVLSWKNPLTELIEKKRSPAESL